MLFRALEKQNKKNPKKIAIIGEYRSVTFGQLFSEVQRAALFLQGLNCKKGDILVIGIPPCPDFYILFYAAAALGLKSIPISGSGKIPPQIRSLGPVMLAGTQELVQSLVSQGLSVKESIVWQRSSGFGFPKTRRKLERQGPLRAQDVLGISTSGTTGDPVLHYRSAEVLPRRSALRASVWGITAKDTLICLGPFTNGANADFHLILPIVVGCTVVVLEKFDRRQAVEAIARHKVTVICSVPLTFEVLAHLPKSIATDFSSVRRCISNGAVLARSIYDRFRARYGIGIGQMYGGSHISPVFTFNSGDLPDAVGRREGPFPVNVIDEHGTAVAPGVIGEIVFEMDGIKDKLLKASLADNGYRQGNYIYTGDLGKFDDRDNLYVVGRKSSLIKVGGNRVIPAEVEAILRSHERIREAVVFPVRPGQTDEAVGAVIVREGRVTEQEIIEHCARFLEPHKCPRKVTFRRSLPRNEHGKIIRYRVTASAQDASPR